jgi:hypothetical protein
MVRLGLSVGGYSSHRFNALLEMKDFLFLCFMIACWAINIAI